MDDLTITAIESKTVDLYSLRKVLLSNALTDVQKAKFVRRHSTTIKSLLNISLSGEEYNLLLTQRPLLRFKPIRNAFTKRGDKILLAKSIGVSPDEINLYIDETIKALPQAGKINILPPDKLNSLKGYVYRHGTKDQLCVMFNYYLQNSTNVDSSLQKNLTYGNGGIADYFTRPIHRMDNKTMIRLFEIVNSGIEKAKNEKFYTEQQAITISMWALSQLYTIQDNSKVFRTQKNKA